jgi:hypothetical protein
MPSSRMSFALRPMFASRAQRILASHTRPSSLRTLYSVCRPASSGWRPVVAYVRPASIEVPRRYYAETRSANEIVEELEELYDAAREEV